MELSERPSGPPTARVLDLVRCPPKGGLRGMITSPKILGIETHYWGGKTVPCGGSLCQACEEQQPARWHGYCGLLTPQPSRHVIVEITLQACEEIWRWEELNGEILGMKLSLARRADRVNGKILVQVDRIERGAYRLPAPPDLTKNLRIIWGIDARQPRAPEQPGDARTLAANLSPTVIDGHHQPANSEAHGPIESRRLGPPDDLHQ